MGSGTKAIGAYSTAMGYQPAARGYGSVAMGGTTTAFGSYSTTMGYHTFSDSYASVVLGQYNSNRIILSNTSWETSDPLLVLGNGISEVARNEALVVYKNGNTEINGNTDISGYTQFGRTTEGAPSIKMKELSTNSAASQNTSRNVPHNLTASKILLVSVLLDAAPALAVQIPPSYTYYTGYEYHYHISATNIVVINSATNSFNILNKPMKILVTYKE